jgi:hypothetical protein
MHDLRGAACVIAIGWHRIHGGLGFTGLDTDCVVPSAEGTFDSGSSGCARTAPGLPTVWRLKREAGEQANTLRATRCIRLKPNR